jgi:hypothetical protein
VGARPTIIKNMLEQILKWYQLRLAKRRAVLQAEVLSLHLKIDFERQIAMLKNAKVIHINHTGEGNEYE